MWKFESLIKGTVNQYLKDNINFINLSFKSKRFQDQEEENTGVPNILSIRGADERMNDKDESMGGH